MIKLFSGYSANIGSNELICDGDVYEIHGLGGWNQFLWDRITHKEYETAPLGWIEKDKLNSRDVIVSGVSRSQNRDKILKIEFVPHFRKKNNLTKEAEMISKLNNSNCVSSPKLYSHGELPIKYLDNFLSPDQMRTFEQVGIDKFNYMVLEYIETGSKAPMADVIFSMLEQKGLGVYHGDIKPDNIRYNDKSGICYLIDYDQAIYISSEITALSAKDFLEWCDNEDANRYPNGPGTWRRHFKWLSNFLHVRPLLLGGALDLSRTTPYKRQETTNTKEGIYHSIDHHIVKANGVRDLSGRKALLDQIDFKKNESVLDIGCNVGLLVHYLEGRGCASTGIELDSSIVTSAKMIANIIGVKANFYSMDLDEVSELDEFDTICLFSFIHHTQRLNENGRKIAESCKRILIECRLAENGKKPIRQHNGKVFWGRTSVWSYPNEDALYEGLSSLFPGFHVARKVGQSDKNRLLLEMKKK